MRTTKGDKYYAMMYRALMEAQKVHGEGCSIKLIQPLLPKPRFFHCNITIFPELMSLSVQTFQKYTPDPKFKFEIMTLSEEVFPCFW